MSQLPNEFNFESLDELTREKLIWTLQRMYFDLARAINGKPDVYQRTTDGQTTDTFLPNGSLNINLNTNKVEMLTNHVSPVLVTWTQLS